MDKLNDNDELLSRQQEFNRKSMEFFKKQKELNNQISNFLEILLDFERRNMKGKLEVAKNIIRKVITTDTGKEVTYIDLDYRETEEFIESVKNVLTYLDLYEKKNNLLNKEVELMAQEIFINMTKDDGKHFKDIKEVIDFFDNKVKENNGNFN